MSTHFLTHENIEGDHQYARHKMKKTEVTLGIQCLLKKVGFRPLKKNFKYKRNALLNMKGKKNKNTSRSMEKNVKQLRLNDTSLTRSSNKEKLED